MERVPVEDPQSCTPRRGAVVSPGIDAEDARRVAELLKAVADPVRLRLFAGIAAADGSLCVCDLPDVGVSQPTVSHHLRKLRDAGLIDCERRGTWVHHWPTRLGRHLAEVVAGLGAVAHG